MGLLQYLYIWYMYIFVIYSRYIKCYVLMKDSLIHILTLAILDIMVVNLYYWFNS